MMKAKKILSALIVVCAACIFLAASYSQASNEPNAMQLSTSTAMSASLSTSPPVKGITIGRARALVAIAVGLISLVIGGLALRSANRTGAIVAFVLGLIAMVLGVVHLAYTTGGFGTGSGRAGAIVALVLGLIGISLGWKALSRSRRSGSSD
jgi:hypothetical protein